MAILNSQLLWWYLVNTGTVLANGYFRFKPNYINPFPIPEITPEVALVLEKLVDKILSFKSSDPSVDVKEIEEKINKIVYELYNLTLEEIELVKKA